jgi:hypothetical protein
MIQLTTGAFRDKGEFVNRVGEAFDYLTWRVTYRSKEWEKQQILFHVKVWPLDPPHSRR